MTAATLWRMSDQPPTMRSVTIGADERGGWSSDRPRTDRPPRPLDLTTRCRVLQPTDRMRYAPGSLLVVLSPSAELRDRFLERVVEDRSALITLDKVRKLLAGRVDADQVDARAAELLQTAVLRRIEGGDAVVYVAQTLDPAERHPYLAAASKVRRPRHALLLEPGRDAVAEDDVAALNALRKSLDQGELGAEGFQTALRVGGKSIAELKKIVFRPEPRDD